MPTLPNELLIPIVEHVYHTREQTPSLDILTLMQTSKSFHVLAQPYLFRSLEHRHLDQPAVLKALSKAENARHVRQAEVRITWASPHMALKTLLACPAVEELHLSYSFGDVELVDHEDDDYQLRQFSHHLYHTTPSQLSIAPCLSTLKHIRIDIDGPIIPFYLTESHQILKWIEGCSELKSLKLWSSDLGGWRYEAMDEITPPSGAGIQEGTLLYFTQFLSKISGLSLASFDLWLNSDELFSDSSISRNPAIRAMLQPVKLLEVIVSEPDDGWLQPDITSLFPSTTTISFLRSPREHLAVSSFIDFLRPLSTFPNLHTIEIDMDLPLNPENRTYHSFSFNMALRHLCSADYRKLSTVRLLFDASQSTTRVAAFRTLYPTLRVVARSRKEVTWEVHICNASQMSGLDDMADGAFKVLTLQGEVLKLDVKERTGRLIDAVKGCVMDEMAQG